MRKVMFLLYLCSLLGIARGQTKYKFVYWYDSDAASSHTSDIVTDCWHMDLNLEDLNAGIHSIHFLISDGQGNVSVPHTAFFMKQPSPISELHCLIDEEPSQQYVLNDNAGACQILLDVSDISEGLHRLSAQVLCKDGTLAGTYESFFIRAATIEEVDMMSCLFFVDDMPFKRVDSAGSNGIFHFDFDVSSISEGLHKINSVITDAKRNTLHAQPQFFFKRPSKEAIHSYQYWLNDDVEEARTVLLEEDIDTLRLISLLPIPSKKIRSSYFHFAIEKGTPVIYAKNDLHIRFFDVLNRTTEACKHYFDPNQRREISNPEMLWPNTTQTSQIPQTDSIIWYRIEAHIGDSLSFRTNRACTIQLFSPQSEELYSAKGAATEKYGGSRAPVDGTYYLAIHDVTTKNARDLAISYQHLDKYAVVEYTPSELGVLPCIQIVEVRGNGFNYMKTASLVSDQSIIECNQFVVEDKATVQLIFTLNGKEQLGQYDLALTFDDDGVSETIVRHKAISLTEPNVGTIQISANGGRSISSPLSLEIKLKNTGNISYINVPFYIAYPNREVNGTKFENFSISADKQLLSEGLQFKYNIQQFKHTFQENVSMIPSIIPAIKSGETQSFKIQLDTYIGAMFNTKVWCGTPWNLYAADTQSAISEKVSNGTIQGNIKNGVIYMPGADARNINVNGNIVTTCMPDPCEYTGIFMSQMEECGCALLYNVSSAFANIYAALLNRHNRAMRDYMGDFAGDYEEFSKEYRLRSPADFISNMAGHCIDGKAGEVINTYNSVQEMIGYDPCPTPMHDIYCSIPRVHDPNDIIGYLSEAGSYHIVDSVSRITYIIEFENDTILATAAAHTIVVRDTLDASFFNVQKFRPMSVKIGRHELLLDEADIVMKNGITSFLKTIDVRPEINAIAQVEGTYNQQTGIAEWQFTSLDPMTMEPTDDIMQGILPMNNDGTSGIGEVMFEVGVKTGKADGTEIANRASIVFDYEKPILTPTWTNIVDAVPPVSTITDVTMENDTIARLHVLADDNRSGVWYYDVYAQYGAGTMWVKVGEQVTDSHFDFRVYEDIDYGYCVVATDSAGNVEQKVIDREWPRKPLPVGVSDDVTKDVPADEAPLYDLQGRPAQPLQPGIYVQRGKKRLVK